MQRDDSRPAAMSLSRTPIFLLDGGLGTTLKDHHHAQVDGPNQPLWSSHLLISDPATLLAVHSAFAAAGADIILTATYQASLEGFRKTPNPRDGGVGIPAQDAAGYMRSAVAMARASLDEKKGGVGRRGRVALSLGAYGAVMVPSQEYTGLYDGGHGTVEQLRDWHAERLLVYARSAAVWEEVDVLAFETIPLLAEIEAVRQTVWLLRRDAATQADHRPFWISCVFPGEDLCLPDGSPVTKVVEAMLGRRGNAALPFAIGINCTKVGKMGRLLREFGQAVQRMIEAGELQEAPELVLYPDGTNGEVYNTSTHLWEVQEDGSSQAPWDKRVADIIVQEMRERDFWPAILVGGCCKTTPDDIRKLRRRIDTLTI